MRTRHRIGGYREYVPAAGAAAACEAFWTHHGGDMVPVDAAHRVLPDPAVSVAFRARRDNAGAVLEGRLLVIGAKTHSQWFPIEAGVEFAAVRLKLEWAAPVLGVDKGGADNRLIDLHEVRPALADELIDRLQRTRSAGEAVMTLARAILGNRHTSLAPRPAATTALDLVRQTSGAIPCARIADAVGLSVRHLRRQVRDAAGLSPKAYGRALRLTQAMRFADRVSDPNWADIAVRSGYCDQSHLIREALALAGASPAQLSFERRRQQRSAAERSNTL
jgi:AraC-like DNA-binding protein